MARTWLQFLLSVVVGTFYCSREISGGTWTDHFHKALAPEWTGDEEYFRITAEGFLEGESASPVAESPLHILEVPAESSNAVVSCWVNVVAPNTRVCTKGALLLRHDGPNGYVFALHEATQTIEVYRLATREMLLLRASQINLRQWYHLRAELNGAEMRFFVDRKLIGSVTDSQSISGKVGVAVQDAEAILFDDFTVSGPNVVGNVDNVDPPALTLHWQGNEVTLRFEAEAGYDYTVQKSARPWGHDWITVTNFTAKIETIDAAITIPNGEQITFYRVEKADCHCR